jgi:hypothetical protein
MRTGDTLLHAGDAAPLLLQEINVPAAVITCAVETSSASVDKVGGLVGGWVGVRI